MTTPYKSFYDTHHEPVKMYCMKSENAAKSVTKGVKILNQLSKFCFDNKPTIFFHPGSFNSSLADDFGEESVIESFESDSYFSFVWSTDIKIHDYGFIEGSFNDRSIRDIFPSLKFIIQQHLNVDKDDINISFKHVYQKVNNVNVFDTIRFTASVDIPYNEFFTLDRGMFKFDLNIPDTKPRFIYDDLHSMILTFFDQQRTSLVEQLNNHLHQIAYGSEFDDFYLKSFDNYYASFGINKKLFLTSNLMSKFMILNDNHERVLLTKQFQDCKYITIKSLWDSCDEVERDLTKELALALSAFIKNNKSFHDIHLSDGIKVYYNLSENCLDVQLVLRIYRNY